MGTFLPHKASRGSKTKELLGSGLLFDEVSLFNNYLVKDAT